MIRKKVHKTDKIKMRFFWMAFHFLLIFLIKFTYNDAATTFSKPSPNPKIIIVGAGASGIAAAVHLIEYGFEDITLLEAEPRIGGRIHTIPFGENVIDLGAQWCHGEKGNIVYDLAHKAGLLEHSTPVDLNYTFVRSNAEVMPKDLVKRFKGIIDKVKELFDEEGSVYEGSFGGFLSEKFQQFLNSSENTDIDKTLAKEFYETFEKMQSVEEASDNLNMVSARDYNLYQSVKGDYILNWKDKGYKEFLRLLMKTAETGKEFGVLEGRVKFSKKVVNIDWQRSDYKTLVKCEDGEEFNADHVIVTVSLGVLKANLDNMFEPPLPAEKQKAIKNLAFGSLNKIFLEFPKSFWPSKWGGIRFVWREEDLKELRSSKSAWLEGLYTFSTLPYQPNILEGWIIGPKAREMENLAMKDIEEGSMYILKRFLNLTTAADIPKPVNVTSTKWFSNTNFRGCYSYHSLETEKAEISNQFLANTLNGLCDLNNYQDLCEKPVLQFAGEATDSMHYSTVHGAVETGYREAQKIRDYYAYGPKSVRELYQLKET